MNADTYISIAQAQPINGTITTGATVSYVDTNCI